jgi:hypothetical protein
VRKGCPRPKQEESIGIVATVVHDDNAFEVDVVDLFSYDDPYTKSKIPFNMAAAVVSSRKDRHGCNRRYMLIMLKSKTYA